MKRNTYLLFFIFLLLFIFLYMDGFKLFRSRDEFKGNDGYLSLFSEVIDLVKTDYVEDVNPGEKYPGAFSSMVSGVDDYSSYLDKKKSRLFQKYQTGQHFDCGVYGIKKANYFHVVDIKLDSPAYEAGLRIGDIIRKANGTSFYGLSFWEMYLSLVSDGPVPFSIMVLNTDGGQPGTFTIEPIPIRRGVIFKTIERDIQLISLMRMNNRTVSQIKKKIADNRESKWIIDLRKYSGGRFDAFLEISKIFIHGMIPLSFETSRTRADYVVGSDDNSPTHCVFIINPSTILYSELLAHVLKVSKAILIGEKTSGFVPYLEQIHLDDGSSLVLNTGTFKINNKSILGTGVEPTVHITTADNNVLFSTCIGTLGDFK